MCVNNEFVCIGRALEEGNQWYYYSRRTQNRMTNNGYWMPMGMEEQVLTSSSNKRVGMKKYYVFHIGESPDGNKTNWIMQEYRLSDSASSSTRSSSSKRKSKSVSIFFTRYLKFTTLTHTLRINHLYQTPMVN
jgi:hypothetical protein